MKKRTYALDLSALAYPLMRSRRAQSVFRYTALLDRPIDGDVLRRSAEAVLPSYPNFRSIVVRGFFWHKLRENDAPILVKEDVRPPLRPFRKEDTNGYPFRLAFKAREIVLEVFHAVADGKSAGDFFSDILCAYVALRENAEIGKRTDPRSLTDPFLAFGKKRPLREMSVKRYNGKSVVALGNHGNYEKVPRLLSETTDLTALKERAKSENVTLTEYLAAAYIATVLSAEPLPLVKPLSLFIPVDLRRFFPTDTLLNFICFERITLPKGTGELPFPYLLREVREQFREKITEENMQRNVDDVVTCFTLPLIARIPLFVKSPCFRLAKKLANKVRQTAILSNVGVFRLPPEAEAHVREVRLFLNINRNAPLNVAVNTYAGKCFLNVTCGLKNTTLPENFFRCFRP